MSNLFTVKNTFILFFIAVSMVSFKVQAQTDTAKKPIVVVRPGGQSTNSGTTTQPVRKPAYVAPTTSERTGVPVYLRPKPPVKKDDDTQTATGSPAGNSPANVTGDAPASSAPVTTVPVTTIPVSTTTVTTSKKYGSGSGKTDTVFITKTDTVKIVKTDTVKVKETPDHKYSSKVVYGELGGPGLAISANYDARISGGPDGFGFRIGAGYYGTGGNTVFTVPIQINYLLGAGNNHIEIGGGTTFLNSTGDNHSSKTFIFDRVTGFIGTALIGYRYQSASHPLNFRINFVPIWYDEGIIWAGGVSIDYTFGAK